MRNLALAFLITLPTLSYAAERVPDGGLPFCGSESDLQQFLVKSRDRSWTPPGDLDCLFLKAGLEMKTLREIKGIPPAGRVSQVRVIVPGSKKAVEGYIFRLHQR
jgi:hypothetical protein